MIAQTSLLATPRRCAGCRIVGQDFSRTAHYCRTCTTGRNQSRWKAQQAQLHEGRLAVAAALAAHEDAEIVQINRGVDGGSEDTLRRAMAAFMRQHGFGRMRVALVRLENELAKGHRRELALEGWIT